MSNDTLTFPLVEELEGVGRQNTPYYCPSETPPNRQSYFSSRGVITATECLLEFAPEPDIVPHEYCFASGAVSFWDNESEDIYSIDDGQAL